MMLGLGWLTIWSPNIARHPRGQGRHWDCSERSVATPYVPLAHGRGADEPSGQIEPARHELQLVELGCDTNVPNPHERHSITPCEGAKLPGEHNFGVVEPVAHEAPEVHTASQHEWVSHEAGGEAESVEKLARRWFNPTVAPPGGHTSHKSSLTAPVVFRKRPEGHGKATALPLGQ